jgi:hypothetical protein
MKIIKTIEDYGWGMIDIKLKDGVRIFVKEKFLVDTLISESKRLSDESKKLEREDPKLL